jgi:type IV secretory pathway VirB2 component (pilin)
MTTATDPATFAVVAFVLYVAHDVGDHWIQTDHQAQAKAAPGWAGRLADVRHVATLTLTQLLAVIAVTAALGIQLRAEGLATGLAVNAASHYWADRRTTLARLAEIIPGKSRFYRLGQPRPERDDNPSLGTGAYALDQSWHLAWLIPAALLITVI